MRAEQKSIKRSMNISLMVFFRRQFPSLRGRETELPRRSARPALMRTGEIDIGQIWGVFRAALRAAERHRGLTVNMLLNVTSRLSVMFAVPLLAHCTGVKRLRHPPGGWKN